MRPQTSSMCLHVFPYLVQMVILEGPYVCPPFPSNQNRWFVVQTLPPTFLSRQISGPNGPCLVPLHQPGLSPSRWHGWSRGNETCWRRYLVMWPSEQSTIFVLLVASSIGSLYDLCVKIIIPVSLPSDLNLNPRSSAYQGPTTLKCALPLDPSPQCSHLVCSLPCFLYVAFPISKPAAVTGRLTILFLHVVFQFQYKSCMPTSSFSNVWSSITQVSGVKHQPGVIVPQH